MKDESYFKYFSPGFARNWNKLSKTNPKLGKLECIPSGEWQYQGSDGWLKNLLNILLSSYYNPKPALFNTLSQQNIFERKEKYSNDDCEVIVINLDQAHKVIGEKKGTIQGEKWPRILVGLSKYSIFKGVCVCELRGHEDSDYNNKYEGVMKAVCSMSSEIFEEYSSSLL